MVSTFSVYLKDENRTVFVLTDDYNCSIATVDYMFSEVFEYDPKYIIAECEFKTLQPDDKYFDLATECRFEYFRAAHKHCDAYFEVTYQELPKALKGSLSQRQIDWLESNNQVITTDGTSISLPTECNEPSNYNILEERYGYGMMGEFTGVCRVYVPTLNTIYVIVNSNGCTVSAVDYIFDECIGGYDDEYILNGPDKASDIDYTGLFADCTNRYNISKSTPLDTSVEGIEHMIKSQLDELFEYYTDRLQLQSGDMYPETTNTLERSIHRLANCFIDWIDTNSDQE